jgi:hypothetical protein
MMSHMEENNETRQQSRAALQRPSRSLFAVPRPIKQLFDRFPLCTYPVNDLPQRAPQHGDEHVLYVFTTEEGALKGVPSYNPACLKWQVREPNDAPESRTDALAGLPQVLQHRLWNSLSEQSCIAERGPSLHDSGFTRAIQTNPASAVWEVAAMGHEQQQQGCRGAWRRAIRGLLVAS